MRGCPRPRAVRYVRTSGKQASPSGPRSYPGVLYPPFVAIRFFFFSDQPQSKFRERTPTPCASLRGPPQPAVSDAKSHKAWRPWDETGEVRRSSAGVHRAGEIGSSMGDGDGESVVFGARKRS